MVENDGGSGELGDPPIEQDDHSLSRAQGQGSLRDVLGSGAGPLADPSGEGWAACENAAAVDQRATLRLAQKLMVLSLVVVHADAYSGVGWARDFRVTICSRFFFVAPF
jgi:hypothetical protein